MKYVRLALDHDPDVRHPMHQFVVEHDGFTASHMIATTPSIEGSRTMLYHVEGAPREDYERALAATETIAESVISDCPDESFYLYVRDDLSAVGQRLTAAVERLGLITMFPISYRGDGTVRVTLVGPGEVVQDTLADLPDGIDPEVLEVGAYAHRRPDGDERLTDRQFAAVRAAVEAGYYDDPREGSVADVAAELDCAPGTAAEHLRRAERRVMAAAVEGTPSGVQP